MQVIIQKQFPTAKVSHLHPPKSLGKTGPGWRGVKRWCQSNGYRLEQLIAATSYDWLIIQVDADIARQSDLQSGQDSDKITPDIQQSCPPITPTIEKLTQVLLTWLGYPTLAQLPPQIIFVIPSQDMENWVFASLFPNNPLCQRDDYECIHDNQEQYPAHLLTKKMYALPDQKPLLRYKDNKIKKQTRRYQAYLSAFIGGWEQCCKICTQANRYHERLTT
ncbi:MAG: hypothetical protein AAF639_08440 [Chloroflexota bacterium]